ncbi:MAG: cyclic nucleotide-binding domain-containing protein [Chloroflexi bacterium]|nr:cyclic nucleotide-binding domain-containing protein [Chloroflexota bacterium]
MNIDFKTIPLFKGLSPNMLEIITPLFNPCTCHEGIVFKQGDPAIYLYLVIEGRVDILYKPYDAPEIKITSIGPGEIFGWSAIAGNTAYTSGATCHKKTTAVRIQGNHLHELYTKYPEAGELLLDRLAESIPSRWKNAHTQVRDILSQSISSHLENEKGT